MTLVLTGIVTLSREPSTPGGRRLAAGTGLAVISALGFGVFWIGLDAGADESVPWALVAVRSTSVGVALAAVAFTSTSLRVPRGLILLLVGVGVFDTAANVSVAFASTEGAVGIVAVLSAMYPVVTIVLARFVLAEQLSATRRVGGVVALGGAALVAVG